MYYLRNYDVSRRSPTVSDDWDYRRGDIYLVDLNPCFGSEQGGVRPVVVLQNSAGSFFCPTMVIAPITSRANIRRLLPVHYCVDHTHGLDHSSVVLLNQIKTIDKKRVLKYMGRMSQYQMEELGEKLEACLGLDSLMG